MIKFFTAFFCSFLFIGYALADSRDSVATISSSKIKYTFIYNTKANRIEIKQVMNTLYISNRFDVNLPIIETYNDEVTIDEVGCKVDNHKPKDFAPRYANYSVEDIFYSDSRICYFPLQMPKKNSTGEVFFSETITDPRYFTSAFFTDELPVTNKEISFVIPRWMKLELKECNFNGFDINKTTAYNKSEDADIVTYTAHNIPATKNEANSPGPTYLYPHLMVLCKSAQVNNHNFTYFASLDNQYDWYRDLVKGLNNNAEAVSSKAKELTKGLDNDMDKIKAIFYYVQDNIRYIAFENGMAGFKPENADEVLRKKYGDCKGMANLTKCLLTSLGYDARLCWLGTNHIAYDYQTPSMAVDNHMICALYFNGKIIYLDATESYLGINEYAERIQGRQVLIENGDKYVLTKIPMANAAQNYDEETGKFSISGNDFKGSVNHLWKGEDKEYVLSGINAIKKENTEDAMIAYLSNHNSDYQITDLKLSGTNNPDKDFTAFYTVDYKNAVSVFSKDIYIDMDFKKELSNAAINLDERKHDYWFEYKMDIKNENELLLPANYKAANIPAALNIVNPDYEFHVQYLSISGKLIYKKTILIKNTHLAVAKFEQWNKDIEQLDKTYNETVTLKPIAE